MFACFLPVHNSFAAVEAAKSQESEPLRDDTDLERGNSSRQVTHANVSEPPTQSEDKADEQAGIDEREEVDAKDNPTEEEEPEKEPDKDEEEDKEEGDNEDEDDGEGDGSDDDLDRSTDTDAPARPGLVPPLMFHGKDGSASVSDGASASAAAHSSDAGALPGAVDDSAGADAAPADADAGVKEPFPGVPMSKFHEYVQALDRMGPYDEGGYGRQHSVRTRNPRALSLSRSRSRKTLSLSLSPVLFAFSLSLISHFSDVG